MKIDKLKISGFKSFANSVELSIIPGITAIVGPNGCGKSNVFESLRWAMGETSAKKMRAGGMDDVIFNGSDLRPAKSFCEVSIVIDNKQKKAPLEFNNYDSLEITRRLDRGDGSSYKVNGKNVRAKDVQMLFQDAGVGSSSAALVSQGKVASIISAKSFDRRSILEEAAGISGLSIRRKESDLKLKATEQNLEKSEEIEKTIYEQLFILKKQAKLASKKKSIDILVRSAEAAFLLSKWNDLSNKKNTYSLSHEDNEKEILSLMINLNKQQEEINALEAEISPQLQVRVQLEKDYAISKNKLDNSLKEYNALKSSLNMLKKNIERATGDLNRELDNLELLNEEELELKDEILMIEENLVYDNEILEESKILLDEKTSELDELRLKVEELNLELVQKEEKYKSAEKHVSFLTEKLQVISKKIYDLDLKLHKDQDSLALLLNNFVNLEEINERKEEIKFKLDDIEILIAEEFDKIKKLTDNKNILFTKFSAFKAELSGLSVVENKTKDSILSLLSIEEGYEKAISILLLDGLSASIKDKTTNWWDNSDFILTHPDNTEPLSDFIVFPKELNAIISSCGVVEKIEDISNINLKLGQSVVSKDGFLKRWDGYNTYSLSNSFDMVKILNRVKFLKNEIHSYEQQILDLDNVILSNQENYNNLKLQENDLKKQFSVLKIEFDNFLKKNEKQKKEQEELERSIKLNTELLEQSKFDYENMNSDVLIAVENLKNIERPIDLINNLNSYRNKLNNCVKEQQNANDNLNNVKRENDLRKQKLFIVKEQISGLDKKKNLINKNIEEMKKRIGEIKEEENNLVNLEKEAPSYMEKISEEIEELKIKLENVIVSSKESEEKIIIFKNLLKNIENDLSFKKEKRATFLAELKSFIEIEDILIKEIYEKLKCEPKDLFNISGLEDINTLPTISQCESRVFRLYKERDSLGAVNLLAEEQVEEYEKKLAEAEKSRNEIKEVVSMLKKSILDFDNEARDRLLNAFILIDGHFKDLFTRLFGGGHAYLKLSGSEDPLDAGLEIYACPPGKKIQILSLMSGGEQALSALALIFAAFLVSPAPVCVLDEVDAPLDDANKEKLCNLIVDMAKNDSTRFLFVSHSALTMSYADQLYGVTMQEKGVSKLVSIDMKNAVDFLESKK